MYSKAFDHIRPVEDDTDYTYTDPEVSWCANKKKILDMCLFPDTMLGQNAVTDSPATFISTLVPGIAHANYFRIVERSRDVGAAATF